MSLRPALFTVLVAILLAIGGAAPAVAAHPASSAPVRADVSDFSFESFDAVTELGIDADGRSTARVTETIVAVFPEIDQNRGIIRAIPLTHRDVDLGVEIRSVTDEDGAPVAWERTDTGGFAELALGTDEFVHGRTVYVIEYELHDVILRADDRAVDEYFMDVNGDGWAQTFDRVTARVEMVPELAAALLPDAACYQGIAGATDRCEIERDGRAVVAEAGPLTAFHTMTIAIGFEPGVVVAPDRPSAAFAVTVLPWLLLGASLALLALAIALRATRWRDPAPRRAIVAEFAPPEPRDVVLDGDLVGRSDPAFAAVVVELAVIGAIRIVELEPDAAPADRYAIELVDPELATGAAGEVLDLLFLDDPTAGRMIAAGAIDAETGAAVHARLATAREDATAGGYRARPSSAWSPWLRILGAAVLLGFALPIVHLVQHGLAPGTVLLAAIAAAASWLVLLGITSPPSLLTDAGADRRDHLAGVREYLTVAEQDRIRMLQSPDGAQRVALAAGVDDGTAPDRASVLRLNERLLPWAVLWGVEDRWAEVLRADAVAAGAAATWTGSGALDPGVLLWATSTSSRIVPIAATGTGGGSSWSGSGGSSFSSGSFGGGFAGGGGGGGGGGGR